MSQFIFIEEKLIKNRNIIICKLVTLRLVSLNFIHSKHCTQVNAINTCYNGLFYPQLKTQHFVPKQKSPKSDVQFICVDTALFCGENTWKLLAFYGALYREFKALSTLPSMKNSTFYTQEKSSKTVLLNPFV